MQNRAQHLQCKTRSCNTVHASGAQASPQMRCYERSSAAGQLKAELDAWDALRATLPVGTISGAPKVRAMQIIDELEVNRRGPYGGGFGHASFTGSMDMALALRTMVIPSDAKQALFDYQNRFKKGACNAGAQRQWEVHIQAGAGLVADSDPESEYQETVNKSNAMTRAIDLAEHAFRNP
jgi:anthranilate synthase component I